MKKPETMESGFHELQTALRRLGKQHEELGQLQAALAASQAQRVDRRRLPMVCYITLSEAGLILEADSSTAIFLGVATGSLEMQPLTRFIRQEDWGRYFACLKQLFRSGGHQTCRLRMVLENKTALWVLLEAVVKRNPSGPPVCRVVMSDITEHLQTDEALRIKNLVFDVSIAANSIADTDGIITAANATFLQLWGYPHKDEVIGKHIMHFPNDPNEAASILAALDVAGRWDGDYVAKRRDGSTFHAHGLATILRDENGNIVGYQSAAEDITECRQAMDALREANELLEQYIKVSPIHSFIKTVTPTASRVLYASDNYQELIGLAGAEMVGKTMTELFPADLAEKITADDLDIVTSGRMLEFEEEFNGHHYTSIKFPILQKNRTLLGGYTIDITERKLLEQTLRKWNANLEQRVSDRTTDLQHSEARFRQLAEATFEGVAVTEAGILLDANAQLAKIHGYEVDEMIGRPVADFVAPESRELVASHMLNGTEAVYEYVALRKDGTVFPAEVHGRTSIWMGRAMRVSASRDLSAAKQVDSMLAAQQIELDHARHVSLINEVSTGIVHQLGQPLSAIGANLSALIKTKATELQNCDSLTLIRKIEADVAGLRRIVHHLRRLANPVQTVRECVNLNDIVKDTLLLMRQNAWYYRSRIMLELATHLPCVRIDAVQMGQVIHNLINNALEASDNCPLERRVVTVTTLAVAGDGVELCVRDAGPGIAPDVIPNLFSPFYTTKAEGLGVGLRISRTIVEAHGGTIQACNNADGVGATFRVLLPECKPA